MALQRQHWKRGHGSNVFLLLDDCMYDRGIFRGDTGKLFRQLFMNGRHRRIFFLNCQQYAMDMPPDLRSQVDVVFQLRDNILSSRKKTWSSSSASSIQFSKTLEFSTTTLGRDEERTTSPSSGTTIPKSSTFKSIATRSTSPCSGTGGPGQQEHRN